MWTLNAFWDCTLLISYTINYLSIIGRGHGVETYRAVTDRCKHCGSLRFHVYPIFSGDRAKKDQLRVLSKFKVSRHQVVIQSDACI